MKHIRKIKLATPRLALLLSGILLGSFALAQSVNPQYVTVTIYYDNNGNVIGADSWGDCPIGSWGSRNGYSETRIYDCDGELPF